MDEGLLTGLISIDLRKAFDTVDHKVLCQKLEHYGAVGKELSWSEAYRSSRKQYCRINDVDSNINNINIGVPQRSCLGSLLFLAYIDHLHCTVKSSKVSMYADDTSIYCSSKNITLLNTTLNEEVRRLDRWLTGNKLSLNVAKTRCMLITSKQKKKCLKASNEDLQPIHEENIKVVCNTKYIGVQIDENLTWKNQIELVTDKASRAVGFLKYTKHFLPEAIVKTFYISIVEPHFQYCCSVWGCCNSTDIVQLQRLQSRAACIVTDSHLGWKTIEELAIDK